jgi:hypothetical protein
MRRVLVAFACACLGLALSPAASAIDWGVTEDATKGNAAELFPQLAELGMTRNVISVTWDPMRPTALPPDTAQIAAMLPVARASGVRVSFAVYLRHPLALSDASPIAVAQFASWAQTLARRFPAVKEFTGPNEPNLPRFWRPQFTPDCANASAAAYLRVQAAMYDALKSFDRRIRVIGGALSGRGNDSCRGRSNVSTSPVRFLDALGEAYRSSGRRAPIMDALSYHPYPASALAPPSKGYAWPNAGVPDLARLKQAFWDAFDGTAQRTFADGLKLYVDETGWQVETAGRARYSGVENVVTIDEATQARYYRDVVRLIACDPDVAALNFFHLVDEPGRAGLQTGLLRADGSRRASFRSVQSAIRERGCKGRPAVWEPATSVVGVQADFGIVPGPDGSSAWGFGVTVGEAAGYAGGIYELLGEGDVGTLERALASGGWVTEIAHVSGTVGVRRRALVPMPRAPLEPGRYVYALRLTAELNPARTFVAVSPPLVVR